LKAINDWEAANVKYSEEETDDDIEPINPCRPVPDNNRDFAMLI